METATQTRPQGQAEQGKTAEAPVKQSEQPRQYKYKFWLLAGSHEEADGPPKRGPEGQLILPTYRRWSRHPESPPPIIETDQELDVIFNVSGYSEKFRRITGEPGQFMEAPLPARDEFDNMSLEQLRAWADDEEMPYEMGWTKRQLIAAIRAFVPERVDAPQLPAKRK